MNDDLPIEENAPELTPNPAETLVCEQIMAELVKLRRKRKIGQEPIAKAIGVTQARISQMENLKGALHLDAVAIYAREVGANLVVVPAKKTKRTQTNPEGSSDE